MDPYYIFLHLQTIINGMTVTMALYSIPQKSNVPIEHMMDSPAVMTPATANIGLLRVQSIPTTFLSFLNNTKLHKVAKRMRIKNVITKYGTSEFEMSNRPFGTELLLYRPNSIMSEIRRISFVYFYCNAMVINKKVTKSLT